MTLEGIDLLDLDRFQRLEHYEMFDRLRAEDPVSWHEYPGANGFWNVVKHKDLLTVNRDTALFSSEAGGISILTPDELAGGAGGNDPRGLMMLYMDPPKHTRYRLLVNKGFTPRMIGMLEKYLEHRAILIVDNIIERGSCDFVVDLASELPLQAIAEIMMKQKSGKILNIASPQGNGGAPPGGDKTNYPYGSAKAGVIQMTKTLARELGGYGINVNCMAPSTVEMRMLSSNLTPQEAGAFAEMRKKGNVLGRLALPVEIANAALFLVSDESSFVSGQLLRVDGGRTDYM